MPGTFPLHQDQEFLSESEWIILKLLCRPLEELAGADATELSQATGGQLTEARCDELIRIVGIHALPGLGSWIARLMAEAGMDEEDVRTLPAEEVMQRINDRAGYPLCNRASVHALEMLQAQWTSATQE